MFWEVAVGLLIAWAWSLLISAVVSALVRGSDSLADMGANMVPALGASLMAGFMVFATLLATHTVQDYDRAQALARQEASAVQQLALHADTLGGDVPAQVRSRLKAYVQSVVNKEWPHMSEQDEAAETTVALMNLQSYISANLQGQSGLVIDSIRQSLMDIDHTRQGRLNNASQRMPAAVWLALFVNGTLVLLVSALMHAKQRRAGVLMGLLLSGVMGLLLTTIFLVDDPYQGSIHIEPTALRAVLPKL